MKSYLNFLIDITFNICHNKVTLFFNNVFVRISAWFNVESYIACMVLSTTGSVFIDPKCIRTNFVSVMPQETLKELKQIFNF